MAMEGRKNKDFKYGPKFSKVQQSLTYWKSKSKTSSKNENSIALDITPQ